MGASAGEIRAGKAFVELYIRDQIAPGLSKAQRTLRYWGSAMSSMGTELMGGGLVVVAPVVAAVKTFADAGESLDLLSKKTGMTVEWLSAMKYAVGQIGGEFEGIEPAVKKMQQTIAGALSGSGADVDAIERLGLSVKDLQGMNAGQQFITMGNAVSRIEDPAQRAAAAVDIFGKAGTSMLPIFAEGAAGLEKWMQHARQIGAVMTSEGAAKATALAHGINDVEVSVRSAGNAVAEALQPDLMELADTIMRTMRSFKQWAQQNRETLRWVFSLSAGTAGFGVALVGLSLPLKAISGIMEGVISTGRVLSLVLNTTLGNIAMLAAAALAARYAVDQLTASEHLYSTALVESQDQIRSADAARLDRLKALSEHESLNPLEVEEAAGHMAILTKRYGDLGVALDAVSGRLSVAADAQKRMNDAMRDFAIQNVLEEIKQIDAEITKVGGKPHKTLGIDNAAWRHAFFLDNNDSEIVRLAEQREGLVARYGKLLANNPGALGITQTPRAMEILAGSSPANARRQADIQLDAEIERAKIEAMQNGEAKELMLLEQERSEALAAAREKGESVVKVEELYQQKAANIVQKYAAERAKTEHENLQKFIEEEDAAMMEEEHNRNEVARATATASDDLAKLCVEATKSGAEKQLALLDIDEREALRRAMEEGVPEDLIKAQFDIRRAMVDASDRDVRRTEAVGMFSPERLENLGFGPTLSPLERTAKASEKIVENTKKIIQAVEDSRNANVYE